MAELVDEIDRPSVPIPSPASDPFSPILRAEVTPVTLTTEQERLITEVLALASSDSRFAQKALQAIKIILAGGSFAAPVISSLLPDTGKVGSTPPPLKLRVIGTNFDSLCVIHIDGNAVNTTLVSATEMFTNLNITGQPRTLQVIVRNTASGFLSSPKPFTVTA